MFSLRVTFLCVLVVDIVSGRPAQNEILPRDNTPNKVFLWSSSESSYDCHTAIDRSRYSPEQRPESARNTDEGRRRQIAEPDGLCNRKADVCTSLSYTLDRVRVQLSDVPVKVSETLAEFVSVQFCEHACRCLWKSATMVVAGCLQIFCWHWRVPRRKVLWCFGLVVCRRSVNIRKRVKRPICKVDGRREPSSCAKCWRTFKAPCPIVGMGTIIVLFFSFLSFLSFCLSFFCPSVKLF